MPTALERVMTLLDRRGAAYVGYLLTGVAVPRLGYEFVWGPSAPGPVRRAFHRAAAHLTPRAVAGPIDGEPLERTMDRLHRAGITGVRHLFDASSTERSASSAKPAAALRRHARRSATFGAERDADRRAFNARFDGSLLTEESARRLLHEASARVTNGYKDYAPIDFGGGLTLGRFLATDSGTGRWDFFNRGVLAPIVRGARVVDLGCNNGSMPLMMLRDGARSVVGIEQSPEIADLARVNARIFSWRDMTSYDFTVVTGDMRVFLTDDLGPVDVVTAFCSLYYLAPADIARVIAKAAARRATLVLQANEAITNLPAGTAELKALMAANGYPDARVITYPGFKRPLLVGPPGPAGRRICPPAP